MTAISSVPSLAWAETKLASHSMGLGGIKPARSCRCCWAAATGGLTISLTTGLNVIETSEFSRGDFEESKASTPVVVAPASMRTEPANFKTPLGTDAATSSPAVVTMMLSMVMRMALYLTAGRGPAPRTCSSLCV